MDFFFFEKDWKQRKDGIFVVQRKIPKSLGSTMKCSISQPMVIHSQVSDWHQRSGSKAAEVVSVSDGTCLCRTGPTHGGTGQHTILILSIMSETMIFSKIG